MNARDMVAACATETHVNPPAGNQLVTAVVTTYKRADVAKRAINSVLMQTYRPLEILVVEDGSESDLEQWCRQTAPGRITYVRHERNRGLAAARNTGMKLAKGSYIAYLDDDDEWKPERIERQMKVVARLSPGEIARLGVVSCGVEMRFPAKSRVSVRGHGNTGNLKDSIIQDGPVTPSSSFLFSRDALMLVKGFDETLPSSIDHDIWMSLAAGGFDGRAVAEPLVISYDRSGRITMMNDISKRIIGVKQYLDKWDHVHAAWLGAEGARRYNQHYFARVITELAAEKFWSRDYKNAAKAVSEIFKYSNLYLFNISVLVRRIAFVGAQRIFPTPAINALKAARSFCRRLLPARD